ncbi:flippase [Herbiconiux sp. CPCC 205716]|uniref:Flippase n=1 Tax=Herbiconiux gentiana TaxID=2970912 RepID=A0ABT2GBY9_9MICO|nr:flippase [Herbiconiux gentiana]MCS5713724.1 flippase [Herbiconiux gentiana]
MVTFSRDSRKSLGNGFWNAGQQGLSLALNAVIGILLVVAVPVQEYGLYSYAVALSSIGVAVMSAGLTGLAVRELVQDREANSAIVASLTLIREFFALVGFLIIAGLSLTSGDGLAIAATLLASSALFGRALNAPELWFLSHLRSGKPAIARISVTVALFGVRLALLALWPNIWVMLILYSAEGLISSLIIIGMYLRDKDSPGFARPSFPAMFTLLRRSWPLMLSSLADQANLKSSVIVIQALLGPKAVGVYAAASRLSEISFFLPVVFMNSTFPVLLKVRKEKGPDSSDYRRMLQQSYDRAFWMGVLVAVSVIVVGTVVIRVVFGPEYADAEPILYIQAAACPFVFMGAVYSKWIIAEGYLWSSLVRHSFGAVVNIALNFALIPVMGVIGAAVATLVSYIAASFVASFLGRRSRFAGGQMARAIVWPARLVRNRLLRPSIGK